MTDLSRSTKEEKEKIMQESINYRLQTNIEKIAKIFNYPINEDLNIRNINISFLKRKGTILFLSGMVDEDIIHDFIIKPLIINKQNNKSNDIHDIIIAKNIEKIQLFKGIVDNIVSGKTILIIDKCKEAYSIDTTDYGHRAIGKPIAENVIKGPHEAFVEADKVNRSLIRKQLRDESLVTERIIAGERSRSIISLMYIDDIVDPELVKIVKKRIMNIKADTIQNISVLEQYIEDKAYSIVPTVLFTERPDRAVAFLQEGHIVMLMDSSSHCLIAPATFWSFFQTAEDSYQRWPYGNFIRILRLLAIFIALLTPSLYVAITTYHVSMVPTDLLLAITATRERVPFPVIIEVLLMEIAFELLKESGIRIPTPMGPSIGIVGGLILGQAAVEANIVSPILVIVVAITGLASFAIPNNNLNFMIRIAKFIFLISAASFGIIGVIVALMLFVSYLLSLKSFGVPFLSPMAPPIPSSEDLILRPPIWKQCLRPFHTNPQNIVRKRKLRRNKK